MSVNSAWRSIKITHQSERHFFKWIQTSKKLSKYISRVPVEIFMYDLLIMDTCKIMIWLLLTYKQIIFTHLPKYKMWKMEKLFKVIVTFLWMVMWMSISSRCMFFRSFVVDVTSFIVRQYLVSFGDLLKPYSCWFLKTKRLYTCKTFPQEPTIWSLIDVTYDL